MKKILLMANLHATFEDGKSIRLHSGQMFSLFEISSGYTDGCFHIVVHIGGERVVAQDCPVNSFVIIDESKTPPQPIFKKIKTRCNLSVIENGESRMMKAGTILDVETLSPNNPDHTKSYSMIATMGSRHFSIVGVNRQHIEVLDGAEEALSVWDDDVVTL